MKRLAIAAAALAALIPLAACQRPSQTASGFDRWVDANVNVVEYVGPYHAKAIQAGGECGGHVPGLSHTLFLDTTCVIQWEGGPGQVRFWLAHEKCHDVLVHIGYGPFGFGSVQAEANANACATAVTGTHPTWTIPQLGYVDPTPAQVRQMRLALTLKGVAP